MGSDNSPTTHYREMIADLRSKLTEAQAKVAKFNRLIKELEDLYGPVVVGAAMTASVSLDARPTVMISPVVSNVSNQYSGLGLGEACVKAMRELNRPATNREIFQEFKPSADAALSAAF